MRLHLTIIAIALVVVAAVAVPRFLNPPLPPVVMTPAAPTMPSRPFTPPVVTVDKLHVRDLLERHDFAALEALFAGLQARFLLDVREETDLWVALETFDTREEAVGQGLDAWVTAAPRSAFARLARATYLVRDAFDRRGERVVRDTPASKIEDMSTVLARAVADARTALQYDARLAAAYQPIIMAARADHGLGSCGEASRAALALAPASYGLRVTTMMCLIPRWGGSYEMTDEFAQRSQKWRDQNPRLEALGGVTAWDRGRVFAEANNYEDAIRVFNRALDFGDEGRFYADRGNALWHLERHEEALADYERAAALLPQHPDVMMKRATLLTILERNDPRIAADVAAVERLDPTNEELEWYRAFPIRRVVHHGKELLDGGHIDEAIAEFTRAHEMGPGKSDALSERSAAWLKKNDLDRALQDLEEDIRLDPTRFISYQRIDWILTKRAAWDRIIEYWDRYIAAVPGDARAYLERGGAYSQKGDRLNAASNASKACERGDAKGCDIVRRHGG